MPTYEYECRSCSHSFEAFQSMTEAPLSVCPECGGPVRRLIGGGTGIIFKGSGFYVNDSRKSSSGSVPASSSPTKSEGESTTATPAAPTPKVETASPSSTKAAPSTKAAEPV